MNKKEEQIQKALGTLPVYTLTVLVYNLNDPEDKDYYHYTDIVAKDLEHAKSKARNRAKYLFKRDRRLWKKYKNIQIHTDVFVNEIPYGI